MDLTSPLAEAWYTALGHTEQTYGESRSREHLLGGTMTASGTVAGNCGV